MTTDSNQGSAATFGAAPQQPASPVNNQQWGAAMPPSIAPQSGVTQDDVLVEPSYDGAPSTFSTMPQSTSLPPVPPARSAAEPAVAVSGDQPASLPSTEVTVPVTEGTVPVSGSTAPQDEPIEHGDAPARTTSTDDERCLQTVQKVLQTTQDTASEITSVKETLNGLSKQFAKRLQYDDEKEAIIDRQHSELLKLREGLKDNLIQPVLYDVAETLDSVHKMRSKLESEAHQVDGMLEDVEFMLLDILEKNDVEEVRSEPGEPFDAARQRMTKVEETEDASKRKIVARSLAPGYMFGKYALFKEKVVVYKVVAAKPAAEDTTSNVGQ